MQSNPAASTGTGALGTATALPSQLGGSATSIADHLRALPPAQRADALTALQQERGNHFTQAVVALLDDEPHARTSEGDGAGSDAPTRLEFEPVVQVGQVFVGDRKIVPAYIHNHGDVPVSITKVLVGGSSDVSATIADDGGVAGVIAPGGYAIVLLTVEPHANGDHNALVKFTNEIGESFSFVVVASAAWRPPQPLPRSPVATDEAPPGEEARREPTPATPTPEQVAPPVHVPEALRVDTQAIQFAAVLGRPVLPQVATVTNPNEDDVRVDVTIEGGGGAFSTPRSLFVGSERKNQPSEPLAIDYMPTRAGRHAGVLVLRCGDQSPIRISLDGEAMKIAGTAEEDAARADDAPPAIELLPDAGEPHTAAQRRRLRDRAADAVSTLPMNYEALIPHADAAVAQFSDAIVDAGTSLQQRITTWLTQEGIAALGSLRANAEEEVAKFLMTEMVDAVADRHPLTMAISKAIQLGYDVHAANALNQDIDGAQAQLGSVGKLAGTHAGVATRALFQQYGGLVTRYASAREALTAVASAEVQERLRVATSPQDYGNDKYQAAANTVVAYQQNMNRLAEAIKLLAAAANDAPVRVEAGFEQLLDRYLRYRATGIPDGEVVGRDQQAERRKVRATGHVNFEVQGRGGAPYSLVLSTLDFGSLDSDQMSDTMRDHAYQKRVSDLRGWDVEIRLVRAHDSGELVLRQTAGGARRIEGEDDHVARAGGATSLWEYIDSQPLRRLQ